MRKNLYMLKKFKKRIIKNLKESSKSKLYFLKDNKY